MIISDLFQETYLALLVNKARSGLTMLGIIIGIGSVIAMISIGQGASGNIESSIQSLGSNLIIVMPGMQRNFGYGASSGRGSAKSLTIDDATAIQNEIKRRPKSFIIKIPLIVSNESDKPLPRETALLV